MKLVVIQIVQKWNYLIDKFKLRLCFQSFDTVISYYIFIMLFKLKLKLTSFYISCDHYDIFILSIFLYTIYR